MPHSTALVLMCALLPSGQATFLGSPNYREREQWTRYFLRNDYPVCQSLLYRRRLETDLEIKNRIKYICQVRMRMYYVGFLSTNEWGLYVEDYANPWTPDLAIETNWGKQLKGVDKGYKIIKFNRKEEKWWRPWSVRFTQVDEIFPDGEDIEQCRRNIADWVDGR